MNHTPGEMAHAAHLEEERMEERAGVSLLGALNKYRCNVPLSHSPECAVTLGACFCGLQDLVKATFREAQATPAQAAEAWNSRAGGAQANEDRERSAYNAGHSDGWQSAMLSERGDTDDSSFEDWLEMNPPQHLHPAPDVTADLVKILEEGISTVDAMAHAANNGMANDWLERVSRLLSRARAAEPQDKQTGGQA